MVLNIHAILGYPLVFIAGLEFLLGLILLQQNPRRRPSIGTVAVLAYFSSAFSLCTGVMYIQASTGASYDLFARLNWIGWFTLVPALQFLYYLQDESGRAAPRIGWALYPVWTVALLLSVFSDLIVTRQYTLTPFRNVPGPLDQPFRLFGALLTAWLIVKIVHLRRRSSGPLRKELTYYFAGVLIFGGGAGLTAGLLQQFGGFGFEPGLSSYFSLPWVLLTFYAIARYQLFDARLILSRTITALTILIVLSLIQAGLFLLLAGSLGPVLTVFATLSLLGLLLFATPFRGFVERWVDTLITQDSGHHREMLRTSARSLALILHLDELLDSLISSLRRGLGVERIGIYLRRSGGPFLLQRAVPSPAPAGEALPDDLARRIVGDHMPIIRRVEEQLTPDESALRSLAAMEPAGMEVVLPLLNRGEIIGVLTVGPRTGALYTQSDIIVLETLAGHAAAALANAILFEETMSIKESLRRSEELFRTLTETAPGAIIIHQWGVIKYANPAAERLFARERGDLVSFPFLQLIHPDDRGLLPDPVQPLAESASAPAEFRVLRSTGESRWVIASASPVTYQTGQAVIATLLDTTDRKNLESKVRYMQKMEAIGKLSGGVAHDFNNILSTIVGQSNLIQMSLPPDSDLGRHAERILEATERAAALTQRLLTFGARKDAQLRPCSLSALVANQEGFIHSSLPGTVRIAVPKLTALLPVMADRGQIERVIMNLAVNARDAMPDGGEITLDAGEQELDDRFRQEHGFGKPGRYAWFSVRDNGTGMEDSVRQRIFEPFFTTKSAGKGTGFGLSIVYDIVKEHHGYITVSSSPGKGSLFTVYLPLAETQVDGALRSARSLESASGLVLLADDDDESRRHFRSVLEGHGFVVVEARNGEEALQLFTQRRNDVRLVISDIVMPRMNGRELFHALRAQRPALGFLFISGYSEDVLLRNGLLDRGQHFLPKPAMPGDIIAMTRLVLGL
ncbi:MAG: ATP-binding protein [Nitrospirota bacterium]|nr:ATP-binding protein [Nitrospirota bacterium]